MNISDVFDQMDHNARYSIRAEFVASDHEMLLTRMVVSSVRSDSSGYQADKFDFGRITFTRSELDFTSTKQLFDRLRSKHEVGGEVFGIQAVVKCNWNLGEEQFRSHHVQSYEEWGGHIGRPNPYTVYSSHSDPTRERNELDFVPLTASGLPFFHTSEQVEVYYLCDNLVTSSFARPLLQIVVDDLRGWFEEILVRNNTLTLLLGGQELDVCEVKVLGYNPSILEVYSVMDVMEHGILLHHFPDTLLVYLTHQNEVVDQRTIVDVYGNKHRGVTYEENDEDNIDHLITWRGENLTLDYKVEWGPSTVKTVVAFANSHGGSILFGILDNENGINVVGVPDVDHLKNQIVNALERTLGYFEHYFTQHVAQNKTVVRLVVKEAPQKPVALLDKGGVQQFYIRRDGSNRHIRREDGLQLIPRPQS